MSHKNPSPNHQFRLRTPVRLGVAAVAACFIANPALSCSMGTSGATVVNGAACITQNGSRTTVTNTDGAYIKWPTLTVPVSTTLHFQQASASSKVFNEVLKDPTLIYGTLSSNGRVWLINPAGIMVGPGGRVDTAGFVASTLRINYEDFQAGRHRFVSDGTAGSVINQGEIRTPAGGSVYLIGGNVANESIISTPQGETILAAGATVSLVDSATPGVKVDITGAAGNATNLGQITAEAGRIGIAGVIVRNSGSLNASSVVEEGGRIFLKASRDAYVDGNGRITTTGTTGGKVEVLGERVAVMDQAGIDASGTHGGGRIMVGGDYQGKNPDVQNADITYFGPNATLKADATEVGAGGTVIVWADDTTRALGSISARGGDGGGDGGFVETSGKGNLSIAGARVDTRAPMGKTGNWLLDPTDVNIVSGTYGGIVGAIFDPLSNSTIGDADINAALSSTSLTIQTGYGGGGTGGITMTGAMISHFGANSLSMLAYGVDGVGHGNISMQNSSIVNVANLTMVAGWDGTANPTAGNVVAGRGNMDISESFIMAAGNVLIAGGGDLTFGSASATTPTQVMSLGSMEIVGRNITLRGGDGTFSGPIGRDVWLKSGGSQTLTATGASGQILLQAGSADNTEYGGSNNYGGGVSVWSDADQTVSANHVVLLGGVGGHDNTASLTAYNNQTINIIGTGGHLELTGGGSAGSYNNQARVQHGVNTYGGNVYYGAGVQSINVGGSGLVVITAGEGTGNLGYYDIDCFAVLGNACRGGSNGATIDNGIGDQVLSFAPGGSLTVTGGSDGTQNWAGVNNKGTSQAVYGSPNITLTGGSGGGNALSYGGDTFELSNDAGIFTEGSGSQWVSAGTLIIDGGTADWGGAGISNESGVGGMTIVTTGNMSMYGGSSNVAAPHATASYVGSMAAGLIDIQVGGDLHIQAGTGTSAPALIGSVDGTASIHIATAPGKNITMVAAASDVDIGSRSEFGGANVVIESGGNITASSTGLGKVAIGSLSNVASLTQVALNARGDISLGASTLIGVEDPDGSPIGNFVRLVAGWDTGTGFGALANASASYGSIVASGASFRTGGGSFGAYASDNIGLGTVNTEAPLAGYQGGAINATANNGTLSVFSVSSRGADGSDGGDGGSVTLWAKGDVTIDSGGINASGGSGGVSPFGFGGSGGNGGTVAITSLTNQVNLNGSIVSNGGNGGDGVTYYGYSRLGGVGGMGGTINLSGGLSIVLGTGLNIDAVGGAGGTGSNGSYMIATGGVGGQGGQGGTISMTGDKIALQANSQLNAHGGDGGQAGVGANQSSYQFLSLSIFGSGGGVGGMGGNGGSISLFAASADGDAISLGNAMLNAGGGIGGIGGNGGSGKAYSAYGGLGHGGDGGQGGQGGQGGAVSLTASDATGGIQLGSAALRVNGGVGGAGGIGGVGKGYSDTDDAGIGYGGKGGRGGAGGGSLGITLNGGSIALNGAILEARGGNGGVAGVAGAGFGFDGAEGGIFSTSNGQGYGGAVGYGGNGGGGGGIVLASLGDIVTLAGGGMLNVGGGSGQSGHRGGWGGNAGTINAMSSGGGINLSVGSVFIKANGGIGGDGFGLDAGNGGDGGTVNFSAYGGVIVGGISAIGARGGNGFQDGGYGGDGGIVTLVSNGGLVGAGISAGGINVYGGLGGDNTGGSDYIGSGGDGGVAVMTAFAGLGDPTSGRITVNGPINARGGNAGTGYYYGYAGNGGNVTLTAHGGIASGGLVVGGIDVSGGHGGDHSSSGYWYGSGGNAGSAQLISYGGIALAPGSVINASGGDGGNGLGSANGGYAGNGGSVAMAAYGGSINLDAGGVIIMAGGGLGGDGPGNDGGSGGDGGGIGLNAVTGSLQLGNSQLFAAGGDGGFTGGTGKFGGSGGVGGGVDLTGDGGIAMTGGLIRVDGGRGGDAGYGFGGRGGYGNQINVTSNGPIFLSGSQLFARGGDGGHSFGYRYGEQGGQGGTILVNANGTGDITLSGTTLDLRGGIGGDSANRGNYGADGGTGGIASLFAMYGGSIFVNGGSLITVDGGKGGKGADDDAVNAMSARPGGDGQDGGTISITAGLGAIGIADSLLRANGGVGGDGGNGGAFSNAGANSGKGDDGGQVILIANQNFMQTDSAILARGGASGDGGLGFGGGPNGAVEPGGDGGMVQVSAGPAAGKFAAIDVIDASGGGGGALGGNITITAGGAILDNNGGGLNLTAKTVGLMSLNGGLDSGLAISVDTAAAFSLTATANGAYGGISIINYGAQPTSVFLADNASSPGAGLGGPFSLSFHNTGDLSIGGATTFISANAGDQAFSSSGTLDYYGGLASTTGSMLIAAGGHLNMLAALSTAGDLKLGAAGALNVDAAVDGGDIKLFGSTININAAVTANNNVALIAPLTGGTINLMGGVTANGLSATPSSITASNGITVDYTGVAFLAGDLFADAGGFLHATHTTLGNVSGLVTGDIMLDNGSNFEAAKDIELVLAGAGSTLSLLNGSYLLASPTTIKLDFPNRGGGGIEGLDHLYVGSVGNVAKEGAGLELKYGAARAVIDPCALNPFLCRQEDRVPTEGDDPVVEPKKLPTDLTTGGDEGSFGEESDEDDKDKKDKKSDEAKDEKKDEKPAQKKVAQCGV